MVHVSEEAVLNPYKFLDTVAKGYHIRLYPSDISATGQIMYMTEMTNKIRQDTRPLVITNINRHTNRTRDFVSVRRMRAGDVADIPSPMSDIDVGEL